MSLAIPPSAPPRRLVYLGTPELAVPPLRALVEAGFEVALVVSQPDRRRGRGERRPAVPGEGRGAGARACRSATGWPTCVDVGADLGVVVAFGRIIKPEVLAAVPMVNLHFSLLPRWRRRRAGGAGDPRGRRAHRRRPHGRRGGLDTGGIFRRAEVEIGPDDTAGRPPRPARGGGHRACSSSALQQGLGAPAPQEGEPTYAAKIEPAELEIDWERPARVAIHRLVRVGGAWTTHDGRRLKIWRTNVPPQGGRPDGRGRRRAGRAGRGAARGQGRA